MQRRNTFLVSLALAAVAVIVSGTCVAAADAPATEIPAGPPAAKRIVFLGDSITYGGTYVEYFETVLRLRYPQWRGEIVNIGLPSETVSGLSEEGHAGGAFPRPDLHERLDRALAKLKPDLIIACYGMNDGIYKPLSEDRFARHRDGIVRLREKAAAAGAKVVLLTPPVYEPTLVDGRPKEGFNYNDVLDRYSEWLLSQRSKGWTVLDLHGPISAYIAARRQREPNFRLSGDGVHPGELGHWLMARPVIAYFGGTEEDARRESIESIVAAYDGGRSLVDVVATRQRGLKDAWLTAVGHKRPGMPAGAPLPTAQANAAELERRIQRTTASAALSLRYNKPARDWSSEALPLGNGRLGCMVFGGVERERIQFNEDSLWTGDENPSGVYESMGAYQNFGDLFLTLDAVGETRDYQRRLDLATGMSVVQFRRGGVLHTREAFASHPDQVIVIRWKADRPGTITGRIEFGGAHGEKTVAEGTTLSFSGKLANGLGYRAAVRAIARGGAARIDKTGLRLDRCDEATLLLAAATDYAPDYARGYRGKPAAEKVAAALDAAARQSFDALQSHHKDDLDAFFGRVSLDLQGPPGRMVDTLTPTDVRLARAAADKPDPALEALLFQYGRYLLLSSSRRPGLPANLQGLWNDSNAPPWSSDYHANINVQMNYWGAEVANLPECHLPLFDLIQSQLEPWRKATQRDPEFSAGGRRVRGWTLRTSHNIFGGLGWQWDKTAGAWYCLHLWEHYAFTQDREFLRGVAYPILKECCEFWEDQLKALPDGRLVAPNAWSPEHGPHEDGVSYSQQIVWDLFNNYVQAAEALGADAAYRAKIAAMRDKLVGPKVGRWGQLQEWMVDRDEPKDEHRHTSHLFAVYPGRQISVARTPDWAKAAAVSLEARGTSGDSRRSWTWPWRCAVWARLGNAEKAHAMIRGLLAHNTLPNLFTNHPPFQMDGNFGYTGAVAEMLVQSHAGEIELLPALPAAWPTGSVRGLKARGNVTVDIAWRDGKLTEYCLTSPTPQTVKVRIAGRVTEEKTTAPGR